MDFQFFGGLGDAGQKLLEHLGSLLKDIDQIPAKRATAFIRNSLQFAWQSDLGTALLSATRQSGRTDACDPFMYRSSH